MKFLPVLSAEDDTTGDANRHEKNKLAPRAHFRTCQLEAGVRGQMPYTVVNWAVETGCAWELSGLRALWVLNRDRPTEMRIALHVAKMVEKWANPLVNL